MKKNSSVSFVRMLDWNVCTEFNNIVVIVDIQQQRICYGKREEEKNICHHL